MTTGDGTEGGDWSEEIRNACYAGTPLRNLTALSYCTYMTANNGQQFPYIELYIDLDGNGVRDDILFFEPPYQTITTGNPNLPDQGPTAMNTWQCWNALIGGWWANSGLGGADPGSPGVKSMDDYIAAAEAAYPGNTPTIVNREDGIGGVRLTVGYASSGDQFDGNVDDVTIGVSDVDTTYDFELQCATKKECEKYLEQQKKDFEEAQKIARKQCDENKKACQQAAVTPEDKKQCEADAKACRENLEQQKKDFEEMQKAEREQCKTLPKN